MSYAQISSLHSRREDANKRFSGPCRSVLSFLLHFSLLPHKEMALSLTDQDLQQYILSQLPEQNFLHLQVSISS